MLAKILFLITIFSFVFCESAQKKKGKGIFKVDSIFSSKRMPADMLPRGKPSIRRLKKDVSLFYETAIFCDKAISSGKQEDYREAFVSLSNLKKSTKRKDLLAKTEILEKRLKYYARKNNYQNLIQEEEPKLKIEQKTVEPVIVTNIRKFKHSITVHTDKKTKYTVKTKTEGKWKRFIIEFPKVTANLNKIKKPRFRGSKIKRLKIKNMKTGNLKIEFMVAKRFKPVVIETKKGKKINFAAR